MDKDLIPAALPQPREVTFQDQNITSPRRQAKSAPTTPKKAQRTAASHIPTENVPDLNENLERLRSRKMPDATHRNLRTATSSSTISSIRGQQFTVGNFSNGLIYLRPKRIGLLTAGTTDERGGSNWENEFRPRTSEPRRSREERDPSVSPPRTPPRKTHKRENSDFYMKSSPPVHTRSHHHRAYSFNFASYRVRPKTAGPEPSFDGLDAKIPNYTLGSPNFSPHGTPFLQAPSSLNLGSTTGSQITDFKWFLPGDERSKLSSSPIPLLPDRENSPFASPPPKITPQIFDLLSFPPFSELPSVVKYDPRNQQILAATPPRIIAQITSATFLDYQLLSDFFLTYRLFMTPSDLVGYLIARLRWAISRNDDIGKVVRVRTFVAIRHWLLNYFGDDFKFVIALNDVARSVLKGGSQSDIKIIGELKKCWRRTCALYWDGEDSGTDITAGGAPGERNCSDRMTSIFRPSTSLHLPQISGLMGSKPADKHDAKKASKKFSVRGYDKILTKAASDASINATSQTNFKSQKKPINSTFMLPSLPGNKASMKSAQPGDTQAFVTKKSKPSNHKRSGSFSDALRDNRQPLPLQNSLARSTHVLMAFPYGGSSLVRGTLLPPTAAYVDVIAPSTPTPEVRMYRSNNTSVASSSTGVDGHHDSGHHHKLGLGGPGMKKFIESLKKTLSGKQTNIYTESGIHSAIPVPKHANGSNEVDLAPDSLTRYVAANYIRSSISSGSRTSGRGWTASLDGKIARIDLLGAGVVDAFQRVVQEEGLTTKDEDARKSTGQNKSTQSKPALRRATVDTTTVGESALSEFDDISLIENFPLSPLTRKRGNTIRRPLLPTVMASGQKETKKPTAHERPLTNIHIEDFGYTSGKTLPVESDVSVPVESESATNSNKNTPKGTKTATHLQASTPSRQSPESFLSAVTNPANMRHSYHSHTSNFDEYSDAASIFGASNEDVLKALPNKLLRRRPGGNLRAATTVTDLEVPVRPNSTGSLSTFSKSTSVYSSNAQPIAPRNLRNEYNPSPQQLAAGVISLGAVAKGGGVEFPPDDAADKDPNSPTTAKELFEQGVMRLAALSDNESDDGGIEVALMKLEGRYERRKSQSLSMNHDNEPQSPKRDISLSRSMVHSHESVTETVTAPQPTETKTDEHRDDPLTRAKRRHKKVMDQYPAANEKHSEEPKHPPRTTSILKPVTKNVSVSPRQANFPSSITRQSAGGDVRDNMSELSSEVSFEMAPRSQSLNRASSYKFPRPTVIAELGITSHPLRHPSSPPLTLDQTLTMQLNASEGFYQHHRSNSDNEAFPWASIHNISSPDSTPRPVRAVRDSISLLQPPSIHLPFILAYDSQLLAKQFTLIEKDALNEIDWKELVELRWKQTSTSVRDWVEFLRNRNVRGVEVIIARFNLMWKWAMSEIVMTRDIDERARTIVKLIHIAAHARKLQNFATMYQITAALLTANISRLRKTWKLISAADMATFKQLEALIQPVRNFHNLRVEMDKVTGETGCIPFVGLFTHDLIYNAQRPSHLTGTPDGELLVNFEKHRMTATIIKRLLRLTEASHKYDFKAADGVCERCLWIASLSDEEIKGLSKNLES
ncbi:hypothetical protein BDZ91DRAFT_708519 [Kalaharituber pfeilii]|nr:hypothetical protein BDZ91DRAFT_708519 [Kalaharituber pfeilii]